MSNCLPGTTYHAIKNKVISLMMAGLALFWNIQNSWHLSIKQATSASVVQSEFATDYFFSLIRMGRQMSWKGP